MDDPADAPAPVSGLQRRLAPTSSDRVRGALAGALLVPVSLVAYLPALHAGFVWDDDDYVTANQTLRSLDGLRRIWGQAGAVPQYYPLSFTSLWVNYQLWAQPRGGTPQPGHRPGAAGRDDADGQRIAGSPAAQPG